MRIAVVDYNGQGIFVSKKNLFFKNFFLKLFVVVSVVIVKPDFADCNAFFTPKKRL